MIWLLINSSPMTVTVSLPLKHYWQFLTPLTHHVSDSQCFSLIFFWLSAHETAFSLARLDSFRCLFFWLSHASIRLDAAMPWFTGNLTASPLIRWPPCFDGLVWNRLLCFQKALSDQRENFSPVGSVSSSLRWHNHGWWILTVVWNVMLCAVKPQEMNGSGDLQYVCVFNRDTLTAGQTQLGPRKHTLSYALAAPSAAASVSTGTTVPHTLQDCKQNKRPHPPSECEAVALCIFWPNRIWGESRWWSWAPLGITPAWVFGSAWDRTLESFRV